MTIRVVLAEDNLLVREGVRRLLETRHESSIEVVAACGDLDGLLVAVDEYQPDVVVTDIRMPPTHTDEGLRAAAALRKSHPQVGVVLLSQFDAPVYARALLEEGSAGRAYLLKEPGLRPRATRRCHPRGRPRGLGHRPEGGRNACCRTRQPIARGYRRVRGGRHDQRSTYAAR